MQKFISIKGAREHNLKNISLDIPKNQLVVITGLSGSGKSSLAFDTIYAEGQRRYVESLSAYARQFLEMQQKPDVDSITGLSPAISIEQKTTSKNPRSTVGTVTEIYDYLRLLFARIGVPYSPATGLPIESQTISQMVDRILNLKEGTKILILAPIVRNRKGEYQKEIAILKKQGFQRIKINNQIYEIDKTPKLDKKLKHNIEVVVDRLIIKQDLGSRLSASLETCLKLSDGLALIENIDDASILTLSAKFACPVSGFTLDEIEPRLFSFNSPQGACPTCDGLGETLYFDPELIIPDPKLSIADGAIAPWNNVTGAFYGGMLRSLATAFKFNLHTPWEKLSSKVKDLILYGSGAVSIDMIFEGENGKSSFRTHKPFEGVVNNLTRRWKETESNFMREELSKFQNNKPCESCAGHRLKPEALCVRIDNLHISNFTQLSITQALNWMENLPKKLSKKQQNIATRLIKEIRDRLNFLNNVGLEYLSLARSSGTLSGGESQRIRLASQIGSGLTGVLYVLDEPSIGLHQRDNARLLQTLDHLKSLDNTVLVVEHDEDTIQAADWVIDMGPKAGIHGGEIVAQGTAKDIVKNPASLTGQYLSGKKSILVPKERRSAKAWLCLNGARGNNLKNINLKIPLGTLTCITGVSGSGKSTLILETLYKALQKNLMGARIITEPFDTIQGLENLDKIIDIDQSPIGRTPRSNPATYTGAFGPIRDWYAGLPDAKAKGYGPGRFSFNVKGGRCEACEGDGVLKIEMHFLPDVYVQCDVCKGKRYERETLEVKFKDKSIADVLDMSIDEASELFTAIPSIRNKLIMMQEVGLGYIKVGQSATTLSGGEAQRVKLAKELSKRSTGKTIYILDEPTTGLHFDDVNKFMEVIQRLVKQGNSVVIIEHNLDVIKCADWVIDLGPEGGDKGGLIIGEGTPEDITKIKKSYTGQFLKPLLSKGKLHA